jgi:tartrate dehydrogenase/decarboxylase/D-malate dehydrogenase
VAARASSAHDYATRRVASGITRLTPTIGPEHTTASRTTAVVQTGQRSYRIAAIPGDGIGREVVPAALEVLEAVGRRFGFTLEIAEYPWGCEHYLTTGAMMSQAGLKQLHVADAILLGAVGSPEVRDHVSLWSLLIPIRREFKQYVNLRPMRTWPGLQSVARRDDAAPLDIVVVRENSEGEYSPVGGELKTGDGEAVAIQVTSFSQSAVDRIIRYAFSVAGQRGCHLTSATKSNGILHTMPFWDDRFNLIAAEHPDVRADSALIDALAARLVMEPTWFDVIVGSNLFGDILSDIVAALAGGLGIAPSANLNPEREFPSMFEPVHGSAPDIAGRGIANPVATIWSGAMMLEHLGEPDAADAIVTTIGELLASGGARTPDIGGTATTREVAADIAAGMSTAKPGAISLGTRDT